MNEEKTCKQTLLDNVLSNLEGEVKRAESLSINIEESINKIKQQPENPIETSKDNLSNDYIDKISILILRLSSSNNKQMKNLNQLNDII